MATRLDAASVCDSDQLCAGLRTCIEGTIHGINELFFTHQDQNSRLGVLLVDAVNAFNSLNHAVSIHHSCVHRPGS